MNNYCKRLRYTLFIDADLALFKEDYVPGIYTISIPPGSFSGDYCIDIADFIVNDEILEATETFTVDLLDVLPCGNLGPDVETEVSILDDDCKISISHNVEP